MRALNNSSDIGSCYGDDNTDYFDLISAIRATVDSISTTLG